MIKGHAKMPKAKRPPARAALVLAGARIGDGRELGHEARKSSGALDLPQGKARREKRGIRRGKVDPATCEREYNNDEIQFMQAMDQYKRENCRHFPTWSETLEVVRALGYRKVAKPTRMPGLSLTMPPKLRT